MPDLESFHDEARLARRRSAVLQERIRESGLEGKPIETLFDLIDYDEGRDPVASQAWLG